MANPLLRRGSRDIGGDDYVASLQQALNEENGCNLTLDGSFGALTEQQVLIYQGNNPECGPVDGIVGPRTWNCLGWVDFMPEPEPDEPEDWQSGMRQLLMRYQMLMWAGAPVLAIVPIWVANRDHPIKGAGWAFPIVVAAFFIPIWLMFGKLFLAFRQLFAEQDREADRARAARIAERELKIRRAERLRNARERLAKIQVDRQAAESHRLALDVDRIRRSLDEDPGNDE